MPKREPSDLARLLLAKAREDETAVEVLVDDDRSADATIGFHAQQAVEKSLKAVLAWHGIDFELRHDLKYLVDLLDGSGVAVPDAVREAIDLTPWAVELRYWAPRQAILDRPTATAQARAACAWAALVIDA